MCRYHVIHKARLQLLVLILLLAVASVALFSWSHFYQRKILSSPTALDAISESHPQGKLPIALNDEIYLYPWHTNVVSTTFWVGETFDGSLSDGSQVCSTYDTLWAYHWSGGVNLGQVPTAASGCADSIFGGCDGVALADGRCETERRTAVNDYFPSTMTPKENPFYLDIPYDDLNDPTAFAERCRIIPWANDSGYVGHCGDRDFSYMKNKFLRIIGPNGHTCYGQVEDAGPSHDHLYHDSVYVFGVNNARPLQKHFNNAGIDVSPALNGCLGYSELNGQDDKVNWQFVEMRDVPDGPWRKIVTSSGVTR